MPKQCDYSECGEALLGDYYEPGSPWHDHFYCNPYCATRDIVGKALAELRVPQGEQSVDEVRSIAAGALNEVASFLLTLNVEPWPTEDED